MDRGTGPELLSEVLSRLFVDRGWGRTQERAQLEAAWAAAAGDDMAARTELGRFRRGVLEVLVSDAVAFHELAQFGHRRLLDRLQQLPGGKPVRELRFRLAPRSSIGG